jgi:hypothetical protein
MDSQTRKALEKDFSQGKNEHSKKYYIDSLQETIDVHDENIRTQIIVTI